MGAAGRALRRGLGLAGRGRRGLRAAVRASSSTAREPAWLQPARRAGAARGRIGCRGRLPRAGRPSRCAAAMGKASSAKKVARAARAGGSVASRERPKLALPARHLRHHRARRVARDLRPHAARRHAPPPTPRRRTSTRTTGTPPTASTCATTSCRTLTDRQARTRAASTPTATGVIHIHPFTAALVGRARPSMKVFADAGRPQAHRRRLRSMPDGTEYENGYDCSGKPAKVAVYKWYTSTIPTAAGRGVRQATSATSTSTTTARPTRSRCVPEGTEPPPARQRAARSTTSSDVTVRAGADADARRATTDRDRADRSTGRPGPTAEQRAGRRPTPCRRLSGDAGTREPPLPSATPASAPVPRRPVQGRRPRRRLRHPPAAAHPRTPRSRCCRSSIAR